MEFANMERKTGIKKLSKKEKRKNEEGKEEPTESERDNIFMKRLFNEIESMMVDGNQYYKLLKNH